MFNKNFREVLWLSGDEQPCRRYGCSRRGASAAWCSSHPAARRTLLNVPTTGEATGHTWHNGVWRGFDMIYLDSAGVVAFMKADDEDNGKAPKSLGLTKQAAVARMSGAISGA